MMQSNIHYHDVAIIGAGPVGLFAVFELGMMNIRCGVIDSLPAIGGQCTALYPEKPIYDIPGFPSIAATDLIENLREQAAPFEPHYHLNQQVVKLERIDTFTGANSPLEGESNSLANLVGGYNARKDTPHGTASAVPAPPQGGSCPIWRLTTSIGTVIEAKAVIIAAGCGAFGPNRPPLDGLEQYEKSSIHYMVARREDFRDAEIVIAGGGDSAVDWAVSLAELARKIYVVHRRDKFRAAPEMVNQMQALAASGKIEMVVPYQLDGLEGEVPSPVGGGLGRGRDETPTSPNNGPHPASPLQGEGRLTAVLVKSMEGEIRRLPAQHLLAFFGLSMELGPIADWGLNLTGSHIAVERGTMETNAKGVFAIGDIATYDHKLKLILCGFSEAAAAAHAIRDIIYPGQAYHFEYSTSRGVPGAA